MHNVTLPAIHSSYVRDAVPPCGPRSLLTLALLPLLLAACGGGGGSSPTSPVTPPTPSTPAPPSITAQPAPSAVQAGQTASFSVTATGGGTLTYQWFRGTSVIAGATAVSYTTPTLTLAEDGSTFSVVVSNAGGTSTSASVTLRVSAVTGGATPRPVRLAVSDGGYALGVRADGMVIHWGAGMEGGTGPAVAGTTARLVSGVTDVVSVSTNDFTSGGGNRSLAITSEGTVWGWGRNWRGGLGLAYAGDDNLVVDTPVRVAQVGAVVQAAACVSGASLSYALRADGSVWLLPGERSGVTGVGTATPVSGLPAIGELVLVDVSGNGCSLLALARDGSVWRVFSRESAYDSALQRYTVLNAVEQDTIAPANVSQLSCHQVRFEPNVGHCLAVTQDGQVWAWGFNGLGQLGLGDQVSRTLATPVPGLGNVQKVWAVLYRSFALTSGGELLVWGGFNDDPMGGGRTEMNAQDHWKPGPVPGLSGVADVAVAPYGQFVTALKTDGTVWSWGTNVNGVFANGTANDTSRLPVQALGLSLN